MYSEKEQASLLGFDRLPFQLVAEFGRREVNLSDKKEKICSICVIGGERRNKLSINSHIQNLKQKHEKLSSEVEQAYKSPALDEFYISQLKKEKLRLKEEISRLSR